MRTKMTDTLFIMLGLIFIFSTFAKAERGPLAKSSITLPNVAHNILDVAEVKSGGRGDLLSKFRISAIDWPEFIYEGHPSWRCDLLIIAPDEFSPQAEELAAWKRIKGFTTRVALLDEIDEEMGGLSAEHIRAYIQDIYRRLRLRYVILFGDVEFIPAHYRSIHPSHDIPLGTDLYYAEMDDEGYYPDLAVGRLSVDTLEEAAVVVNKIINYEQHSPFGPTYYQRMLLVSYFEDWNSPSEPFVSDGKDESGFLRNIEEIHDFLESEGEFHYFIREYATNKYYWPEDFDGPQWYDDGTPVPTDLRWPEFAWDGSAEGIIEAINSGTLLTLYMGHGKSCGWSRPNFTHSPAEWEMGLPDLDNSSLPTVTLNFACRTGWYDHETDEDAPNETFPNEESFAEVMLRMDGGAVAVVAASRNCRGHATEDMAKAFIDGIWGGMLPTFPSADSMATKFEGSKRLGDVLNFAKFYIAEKYGDPDDPSQDFGISQVMFEVFHLFGDPTMELANSPWPSTVRLPFYKLKRSR